MSPESKSFNRVSSKERRALAEELERYDCSIFMMFDPVLPEKEMNFEDLRLFLEEHKTGFTSSDLMNNVLLNIPVETAFKTWLETIENIETRNKYSRAMRRVFSIDPLNKLISERCAITNLDKNWSGAKGVYNLIKTLDITESAKVICRIVYSKFCDFLREATLGAIVPEDSPEQSIEIREAQIVYNEINWEKFIAELRPPYDLLAEMTWLAAENCEVRLRLVNPLKDVLKLMTSQIDFKNNRISFDTNQIYSPIVFGDRLGVAFPPKFMKKLQGQLNGREGLVFLTRLDKPTSSIQVQREFKRVSSKLKHEISPVLFGWVAIISGREKWAAMMSKKTGIQ